MRTSLSSRPSSAHPRAGGENNWRGEGTTCSEGSSPRGRGKPMSDSGRGIWLRLIPALAGKTQGAPAALGPAMAHPRAGGENQSAPTRPRLFSGSSPRWRGKRSPLHGAFARVGLIPALAGKTWNHSTTTLTAAAHPRAGGENHCSVLSVYRGAGSSPRWRGKRGGYSGGRRHGGLIPALAGKTAQSQSPRDRGPAHPRAGGENERAAGSSERVIGSSPRWRGKRR